MSLQPHQQRVVDERTQLDEKLVKLNVFTTTCVFESLPETEKARLIRQRDLMQQYSGVLGERIAWFTEST